MQARCRVTGEDYAAVVQSIRDSFQPQLLDVFCELQLNVASADATEGMLKAEIEHIVSSIKNDTLPDIKELFKKELRMNLREIDVNARLIDYYNTSNTIVDENGLTECFSGANGTKEKCKRLIANLLPQSLKQEVKQCVRFTRVEAAKDPKVLFRLVLDKANELERQHARLKRDKRDASGQDKDRPKFNQPGKMKKRWDPTKSTTSANDSVATPADRTPADSKTKSSVSTSSNPPPAPCPKCQEMHWLRDCPKASRQEKEELWKKMRDARGGNKKARLKRLGELLPSADRVVLLNGQLELPYCPDSGFDYTVIGRSHWEQLKTLDPSDYITLTEHFRPNHFLSIKEQ